MSTRLVTDLSTRHLPSLNGPLSRSQWVWAFNQKKTPSLRQLRTRTTADGPREQELSIRRFDPLKIKKHIAKSKPDSNPVMERTMPRHGGTPRPESISIDIDGRMQEFSTILLRDLCSCPLCIDQSTRQKLFVTAEIPYHIKATICVVGPESITISWKDDAPGYRSDHKSEIPYSTLRRIVQSGKAVGHRRPGQELPDKVYWAAKDFTKRDIEYEAYMNDDNVLLGALQQLHTHGLLFIQSVPEDAKSVEILAERIGPLKTTFYGRTWDVRSVPEAKNVAYTSQNLGFHMDLLYMKQPPHLQLLHCIRSSSAGGASLFTDSFRAVQDLQEDHDAAFNALSMIKAAFHYDHPGSHYYHQFRSVIEQEPKVIDNHLAPNYFNFLNSAYKPKESFSPMDFVSSVAWSPPFQAPFALDREIVHDFMLDEYGKPLSWNQKLSSDIARWNVAARLFNKLIHRPHMIYERLMKPGECVIFDNRRVLHARKAFTVGDAGKERWLRGAYIDKDPYMSKLKIMTEQNRDVQGAVDDVLADLAF